MNQAKIKLYRHPLSGHSHRVELLLNELNIPFELVEVDLANGEHKSETFLKKNFMGQVPVIEDADTTVADSVAILVYLAEKYAANSHWYPSNTSQKVKLDQLLSIAANELANGPGAARLVNVFGAQLDHQRAIEKSHSVLTIIEKELSESDWLLGNEISIADIAFYAYIAHAPEGDVSLETYPNVRKWLAAVEARDSFVPMQATPVGLAA